MRMWMILLFIVLVASCKVYRFSSSNPELVACETLAATFFRNPLKQRINEFKTHDLKTQYQIYLCGNQYMHPPALLAPEFALGGEPVANFLREKLLQTKVEATIRDIALVLVEMQRQDTYYVKGDGLLVQLLDEKIRSIQDDFWQKFCSDLLEEIEGN